MNLPGGVDGVLLSLLHLACVANKANVVAELVASQGVDVHFRFLELFNIMKARGLTPLHWACLCNSADAAEVLLQTRDVESDGGVLAGCKNCFVPRKTPVQLAKAHDSAGRAWRGDSRIGQLLHSRCGRRDKRARECEAKHMARILAAGIVLILFQGVGLVLLGIEVGFAVANKSFWKQVEGVPSQVLSDLQRIKRG
jgi:hypothetical protein